MAAAEEPSRRKMIRTAALLLQQQGYHATGLRQILAESGAPRGSLYFHFPGGKEQLAVEAVREAGEHVAQAIAATLAEHPAPGDGVRAFFRAFAETLRSSDFRDGCPVATVTLEASADSEAIREECDATFRRWQGLVRDHLRAGGFDSPEAEALAAVVLSSFEGALIVARARRDTEPLLRVGEKVAGLLAPPRGHARAPRRDADGASARAAAAKRRRARARSS